MSVVEKIKLLDRFPVKVYTHVKDLGKEKTAVLLDDVLKILPDYHLIHKDWKDPEQILDVLGFKDKFVVEKQKLQELADLMKTQPRFYSFEANDRIRELRDWLIAYKKKFVEAFGVETETEKIMKDKKLPKLIQEARKKGSHCSPYKPLVESTKKETAK